VLKGLYVLEVIGVEVYKYVLEVIGVEVYKYVLEVIRVKVYKDEWLIGFSVTCYRGHNG